MIKFFPRQLFRGTVLLLAAVLLFSPWTPCPSAQAATLTGVSLTLGTTKPAAASNLSLAFTVTTQIDGDATSSDADGSIILRFPQVTEGDPFVVDSITTGDVSLGGTGCGQSGITVQAVAVSSGGGSVSNDTITIDLNQTSGTPAAINITAGQTCTVTIVNTAVTNPTKVAAAGTSDIYSVSFATENNTVNGTDLDTASSKVAITDAVTGSATVNTTLTLTVAAVASEAAVRASTADVTTTATTLPWGILAPNTPKQAGHTLTIVTNAPNGYNCYIIQNQNLTSGSDDIDQFKNGTRLDDASAAVWIPPIVNTNDENSQGHMGYGSSDTSVFTTNTFFAGIPTYSGAGASGPDTTGLVCDNTTAVVGDTCTVEFQVEISGIQPAGTYSNELQYILVPRY